jgi:hypothetical protein
MVAVRATEVKAEESVNPDGVLLNESVPVKDETLAEVHGTGLATSSPLPPSDVAVILWDEQPKTKPAPTTTVGDGSGPPTASIRVR